MRKYRALIRKLVDATVEAETHGEDVVEILKERCFNDTSLVRQTLMNAVCNPRFKLFADVAGYWRQEARNTLEQLADQLEKACPLTEETATDMLETFLSEWLRMSFVEAKRPKAQTNYFKPKEEKKNNIEEAADFLDEIEKGLYPPEQKSVGKSEKGESSEEEQEQDQEQRQEPTNNDGKSQPGMGIGNLNTKNQQQLEERFLHKMPPSLVELARLIGRMGDTNRAANGKFMKAGKSDIVGITTGNDLNAIMPTELALLAEQRTQTIFYHKYSSRQLQLFASASQSKSPDKHQDGPVIICVDTSSSMMGEPVMVAKALAVAVAIIAWRKKRDVVVVKYSDTYDYMDLGHKRNNLGLMSHFFSAVSMAGNNENGMFQWLFNQVKPTLPTYDTADILCISDFGWMRLDETTKQLIEEQKQSGMRFYGLNVHSSDSHFSIFKELNDDEPMEICDSVWTYQNGECKEVFNK